MRILITGASGFIGSHLLAGLAGPNRRLIGAVRDPAKLKRRFPAIETVFCDFSALLKPADWRPLVDDVDVVINCAGVLQSRGGQRADDIHDKAPRALFDACLKAGVKKLIQISAIGIDSGSEFAATKKAADDHLQSLDTDWIILRPSLVYGRDTYGGTAMLRALAVCPFAVPAPAMATGFQPIHVLDLTACVERTLTDRKLDNKILCPCGPEIMTPGEIALAWRAWLGLPPAHVIEIPLKLMAPLAWLGDRFGRGPLAGNALKQIEHGQLADYDAYCRQTGLKPAAMSLHLAREPANTDALWHARLYLLAPLLHVTLILVWAVSGFLGLLLPVERFSEIFANHTPLHEHAEVLARATGLLDLLIALGLITRFRPPVMFGLQMAMVAGYTIAFTIVAPDLWLDPLGPLLKNLPILALIMCHFIVERQR
jgi:uncharacterized protein YbjT (DUF2867 family)